MVNYGGAPNIENVNCTCANLRSSDDCRHWVSQIVHVTVSLSDDRDMLLAGHNFWFAFTSILLFLCYNLIHSAWTGALGQSFALRPSNGETVDN